MAFTAGTGNIKLRNIEQIDVVGEITLNGCNIENGASLSITDGDMLSLACGSSQEISEKANITFNYIPESASDGAAVMAFDGTSDDISLTFLDGTVLTLSDVPIAVNKKIVAGQPTKLEVTIDVTKSNIDEILTYA